MKSKIKIALIAGEDSGDLLGSELIAGLRNLHPEIEFFGVGGNKMEKSGMRLISSNQEFAIMGLYEVIKKLPKLLRLRRKIIRRIIEEKPDLFIGIDAPDLNFPIEKKLKSKGIRIIHYVSPSIWAWRPKRAIKISHFTDLIMTLFPFEPKYYEKAGGKAKFVGHPLAQSIPIEVDKPLAKKELNINPDRPTLALLPGSRGNELKAHTGIFIETAARLLKKNPQLQILSANTNAAKKDYIQKAAAAQNISIQIFDDATKVLKASDYALLASGTVALEAMLCKTPMVVGYKISPITYSIVKAFNMMLLPYYSLPNVIYGDFLVSEVLQKEMTAENLYRELEKLEDSKFNENLRGIFTNIHKSLLAQNDAAAKTVIEILDR